MTSDEYWAERWRLESERQDRLDRAQAEHHARMEAIDRGGLADVLLFVVAGAVGVAVVVAIGVAGSALGVW